jgi:hypothetical protein
MARQMFPYGVTSPSESSRLGMSSRLPGRPPSLDAPLGSEVPDRRMATAMQGVLGEFERREEEKRRKNMILQRLLAARAAGAMPGAMPGAAAAAGVPAGIPPGAVPGAVPGAIPPGAVPGAILPPSPPGLGAGSPVGLTNLLSSLQQSPLGVRG